MKALESPDLWWRLHCLPWWEATPLFKSKSLKLFKLGLTCLFNPHSYLIQAIPRLILVFGDSQWFYQLTRAGCGSPDMPLIMHSRFIWRLPFWSSLDIRISSLLRRTFIFVMMLRKNMQSWPYCDGHIHWCTVADVRAQFFTFSSDWTGRALLACLHSIQSSVPWIDRLVLVPALGPVRAPRAHFTCSGIQKSAAKRPFCYIAAVPLYTLPA